MPGSSARGPRLHRIWGDEPPPPTTTGPGRRQLTVQSRGFFTSRHGKVAQLQSLGHERVATLAFTLKVHPVTGGTDFQALLFHFKPGELTFELLNARVQAIDLGPVTARWSGGERLVPNLGEIDGDAHLSIIAGPSRQPQTTRERPSGLRAGTQPVTQLGICQALNAHRVPHRVDGQMATTSIRRCATLVNEE